jgi:hypothetical protein
LIYLVVETGKSEICRAGQQAGNFWVEADITVLRQNFFFGETAILFSRPFN